MTLEQMTEADLRRLWPLAFNDSRPPLKVGIHKDMGVKAGRCAALAEWVQHPLYLKNLARGEPRINLYGAASRLPVNIVSRHKKKSEVGVLDTAASIALTEQDCQLISRIFCDTKASWVISIELHEWDQARAKSIGERFASAMERVNRGHNGVGVTCGEAKYFVEPYWKGDEF